MKDEQDQEQEREELEEEDVSRGHKFLFRRFGEQPSPKGLELEAAAEASSLCFPIVSGQSLKNSSVFVIFFNLFMFFLFLQGPGKIKKIKKLKGFWHLASLARAAWPKQ